MMEFYYNKYEPINFTDWELNYKNCENNGSDTKSFTRNGVCIPYSKNIKEVKDLFDQASMIGAARKSKDLNIGAWAYNDFIFRNYFRGL